MQDIKVRLSVEHIQHPLGDMLWILPHITGYEMVSLRNKGPNTCTHVIGTSQQQTLAVVRVIWGFRSE